MPGQSATGTLSYNGYTFEGASHVNVDTEFVYDSTGQTVIYHKYRIRVRTIVADDDLDDDLLNIRRRLGKPGRTLVFTGRGFGDDLAIPGAGVGGRVIDVNGGPYPKVLSWTPIGDDRAAEIDWMVETTIPVCVTATFTGVMELSYDISYAIDRRGMTTRTISGFLRIARKSDGQDTADRYRDRFQPPPIAGFTREQSWSLDQSKTRIDFTITDTEIASENPYPRGVTNIEARHRSTWRRGNGSRFFNTITATIELAPGQSGVRAWHIFASLVTTRMEQALRKGRTPFLWAFDVDEAIFGRDHAFTATYRLLSCISDFIGDSGLFEPLNSDWTRWRQSLISSTFNQRGWSQLRDNAADNVIVNLCDTSPSVVAPNNVRFIPFEPIVRAGRIRNAKPDPRQSWLMYESACIPSRKCPTVRQPIIQAPASEGVKWDIESGEQPSTNFGFNIDTAVKDDVVQEGGAPRYSVRYVGMARRAGHKIGRPAVEKVGDVSPTEVGGKFVQTVVGNYFGQPVYQAQWDIDYVLPRSPGTLHPPYDIQEWVDSRNNTISPG